MSFIIIHANYLYKTYSCVPILNVYYRCMYVLCAFVYASVITVHMIHKRTQRIHTSIYTFKIVTQLYLLYK